MSFTTRPSRRAFLFATIGGAAVATLPKIGIAGGARADIRALAFDGDRLISVGRSFVARGGGDNRWTDLVSPGRILSLATHRDRPGLLVAGLAENGVAVSNDGGETWRNRTTGLPTGEVRALAIGARDPDLVYAAIPGDGLWKTEDAGATWALAMDRPWLDEAERDPLTLASVDLETGMGGIWIYAGTEKGLTRVPDCFCRWQDVQPGNAMDALVAGDAPPAEAPLPANEPVLSLASAPSTPSILYAALPSGVWTSQDGGVVWTQTANGQGSAIAVHPGDENHVAAVLDGTLKLSRDGGATWAAVTAA